MKSLGFRLAVLMSGAFLLLGLFSYLVVSLGRAADARQEALRRVDDDASTLCAILGEQFSHGRHENLAQEAVRGAALAHRAKVMVVGASGRIMASHPPRSPFLQPAQEPDCAECHLRKAELPTTYLSTGMGDGETAMAFREIPRRPVCQPCHPAEGRLGYVYFQIPAETLASNPFLESLPVLVYMMLAIAVLLFAGRWLVTEQVLKPIYRVRRGMEETEDDAFERLRAANPTTELLALSETVSRAKARWRAGAAEVAEASLTLEKAQESAREWVKALRSNVEAQARTSQESLSNLRHLDEETDAVLKSLEGVAESLGDNSDSFSSLATSVDDVARDAAQLSEKVVQVVDSVSAMSRSVNTMAEHTEQLSGRAETARRSMSAIGASSSDIRANARAAAAQSGQMAETAVEGLEAVRASKEGIHRSYDEILAAAGVMGELKQASRSVGDILKIINEINDKTKLLALNAAIIASQSGEHGKSFGVVANEIKSLSDRTALSTGDISQIIVGIQERVDAALSGVRRGEESLGGSVELVERAGTLLENIADAARVTHAALLKINELSQRQTALSESVDSAVALVARMTEETRDLSARHKRSGDQVDIAISAMGDLTEHLREAAREQAETSRFLAEAFHIVNSHLRSVQDLVVAQARAVGQVEGKGKETLRRAEENRAHLASLAQALDAVEQSRAQVDRSLASLSRPRRES